MDPGGAGPEAEPVPPGIRRSTALVCGRRGTRPVSRVPEGVPGLREGSAGCRRKS
ncbi:hypothetical protein SLNWT_7157 [Streptomyces albus]|uniref:Uncharacterized protein n=1 Tax=Streptomyces albus (strain ATCC 21838 / DSM 41398 / FERM P-419 / JCM 4703 / NBRC 107858) TaxID=1081613 RepID=A0A0B5EXI6_STRA4|nr:hypothetical protein SLNWT_7157 [Streptomyces albus]AOU81836.1 hypothetical protein SLNHY_7145 [Streptomyces albus]